MALDEAGMALDEANATPESGSEAGMALDASHSGSTRVDAWSEWSELAEWSESEAFKGNKATMVGFVGLTPALLCC